MPVNPWTPLRHVAARVTAEMTDTLVPNVQHLPPLIERAVADRQAQLREAVFGYRQDRNTVYLAAHGLTVRRIRAEPDGYLREKWDIGTGDWQAERRYSGASHLSEMRMDCLQKSGRPFGALVARRWDAVLMLKPGPGLLPGLMAAFPDQDHLAAFHFETIDYMGPRAMRSAAVHPARDLGTYLIATQSDPQSLACRLYPPVRDLAIAMTEFWADRQPAPTRLARPG